MGDDNRGHERPDIEDAEPMRRGTELPEPNLHPSRISGARIALISGDSPRTLKLLGETPPQTSSYSDLQLCQRWRHLTSEALISHGRLQEAEAHCLAGLELHTQYPQDPSEIQDIHRDIYTLAFVCTLAEIRRRSGTLDEATVDMLIRELSDANPMRDYRFLALQYVGFRTLALHVRSSRSRLQFRPKRPAQLLFAMSDSVLEEFNLLTKGVTPTTSTTGALPAADSRDPSSSPLICGLIDLPYPSEVEDVDLPSLTDYARQPPYSKHRGIH